MPRARVGEERYKQKPETRGRKRKGSGSINFGLELRGFALFCPSIGIFFQILSPIFAGSIEHFCLVSSHSR